MTELILIKDSSIVDILSKRYQCKLRLIFWKIWHVDIGHAKVGLFCAWGERVILILVIMFIWIKEDL